MVAFVLCPAKNQKRAIDVCLTSCKEVSGCQAIKGLRKKDPEALPDAMKRLKIPLKRLAEFEEVIDVTPEAPKEETPKEEGEFKESPQAVTSLQVVNQKKDADEEKELYEKAWEHVATIKTGFLELGATLQVMFLRRFFHGYSTWEAFVQDDPLFDTLEIRQRTADYLRAVNLKYIGELKISREECIKVGYTKLAVLLPVVTPGNVRKWLKDAKELKTDELRKKVQGGHEEKPGKKGSGENVGERTEPVTYYLHPDQKEEHDRAMELAGIMTGNEKPAVRQDAIMREFISTYAPFEGEHAARIAMIRNHLQQEEATLDVIFSEVIDRKSGEIIWGEKEE